MAHWASLIILALCVLTVGPLQARSKCVVYPNPLKVPIEQCKLNINFCNTCYSVFSVFWTKALKHLYLQYVNSITSGACSEALWYRAACLLIQKKKDIIGTTCSESDNALSVKRALGLWPVLKKCFETTILHKQLD